MLTRIAFLLSLTVLAQAVPSKRPALLEQYRQAVGHYAQAARAKEAPAIATAITELQAVGAAIVEANKEIFALIANGTYPADVKSSQARLSYDRRKRQLRDKIMFDQAEISAFVAPQEITPESLRTVDRFISVLSKAIESHHDASQNVR